MRKLISLIFIMIILTGCNVESETLQSTIHDKFYQSSSVNSGVGVGANGQVGVITTSSPSKYEIVLDSGVHSIPEKQWLELRTGQVIEYEKNFFGIKVIEVVE